jgi:hypothetical protein
MNTIVKIRINLIKICTINISNPAVLAVCKNIFSDPAR